MTRQRGHNSGFTLIELLVVIAIIGLLSTFAVVSLNEARLKARDARRLADIKQMMTAVELFYLNCGRYPDPFLAGGTIGRGGADCPGERTMYLALVPSNPLPRTDGGCLDQDYIYFLDDYQGGTANSYHITYCIGTDTQGIIGGVTHCATPAGMVNDGGVDCTP